TETDADDKREQILKFLSKTFGVQIKDIVMYLGNEAGFHLITGEREIIVGSMQHMLNQGLFRITLAQTAFVVTPNYKPGKWRELCQAMIQVARKVEMGSDTTTRGMVDQWITHYFESKPPTDNPDEAVQTKYPFLRDNATYIFGSDFRRWVGLTQGERLGAKLMGMHLRVAGLEPEVMAFKTEDGEKTTRSVWKLNGLGGPKQSTLPPEV
ncbi:MAG: hypothetical protein V3T23_12700, partial [Nitrososphaerales archaeon]